MEPLSFTTLDDLRRFVRQTLCERDRLDPAQTPLREDPILRRGRPCGLFFQADGPRRLKNFAVWTTDESRVLFYDSTGQRYADVHLSDGPEIPGATAA